MQKNFCLEQCIRNKVHRMEKNRRNILNKTEDKIYYYCLKRIKLKDFQSLYARKEENSLRKVSNS